MNLYEMPNRGATRWISFENQTTARGNAGLENQSAKGHAFERLQAGEAKTLLDVQGSGKICYVWLTVSDRSPEMMRSLRLDMFWDGCAVPAVSCPLGDFFGVGLGQTAAFESRLFSNPEGRSFICFVPMPFRTGARVVLTNESATALTHLFYEINLLMDVEHSAETLYFHTHWRRESPNALGKDYDILPKVKGRGRYLGCNMGVIRNAIYEKTWWGEGEVKAWFGDDAHPTLCGTGAEDYIGTAWGQKQYTHQTLGCTVADGENGQWTFYRYHLDDPVYFHDACRIAIQTIGGAQRDKVLELLGNGAPLIPISIDVCNMSREFFPLMDRKQPVDLNDPDIPAGWCNFWRQDDWSSAAYFYLDSPHSALPPLQPVKARAAGLLQPGDGAKKRLDE